MSVNEIVMCGSLGHESMIPPALIRDVRDPKSVKIGCDDRPHAGPRSLRDMLEDQWRKPASRRVTIFQRITC
jgi:hypothetical protein